MLKTSWNNSIFVEYNKDSNGNVLPERIQNENIVVQSNACGQLSQIPYYKNKIIIDNFLEVYDQDIVQENQFKVIYGESALIFFHPSMIGKSVVVREYYGVGICLISANRIISGFDSIGNPIVQSDVNRVVDDYDNRVKLEFQGIKEDYQLNVKDDYSELKDDYQTNIINNYQSTVKEDYQTNIINNYQSTVKEDYSNLKQNYQINVVNKYNLEVKQDYKNTIKDSYTKDVSNAWTNELKPELENAIKNYHNSTNPTWITTAHWTKTITKDNTGIFQLDLSSFNPISDQISKFAYQSNGQEGCVELIKDEHWRINGATIELLRDLVFMNGDKVFVNVYRGVAVTPISGTNGGDLQNKSVIESKLSQDVQDKLNSKSFSKIRYFEAVATNTTKFIIDEEYYNPNTDQIEIYQDNLVLHEDENYTRTIRTIALAEPLGIGDRIYYKITKSVATTTPEKTFDGSLLEPNSVTKSKLTTELSDKIYEVDKKISKSDIANDLTTGGTTKVVSAEQIKIFNDNTNSRLNTTDLGLTTLKEDYDDFKKNGGVVGGSIKGTPKTTGHRAFEHELKIALREALVRCGTANFNSFPAFNVVIEDRVNTDNVNGFYYALGDMVEGSERKDNVLRPVNVNSSNKNNLGGSASPWDELYLKGRQLSDNGYSKMQNGMIIQWGADVTTEQDMKLMFPITFPNKCFTVSLTPYTSNHAYSNCSISNVSRDSFIYTKQYPSLQVRYIAIGW